jgi:TetR/AcrR family transcriptional repressor of nem operon
MIGGLAVARGAARGNPAVSEQVLQAARRQLDELMLAPAPARADDRPAA